jgi:cell division protein FtsI/penicillin-binding protein 2
MEQPEYEAVRKLIKEKSYSDCMNFRDEAKRYYPNDVLAANVLGFVGTDDKGLDGIEQGHGWSAEGRSQRVLSDNRTVGTVQSWTRSFPAAVIIVATTARRSS